MKMKMKKKKDREKERKIRKKDKKKEKSKMTNERFTLTYLFTLRLSRPTSEFPKNIDLCSQLFLFFSLRIHAADVTQSTHFLMSSPALANVFTGI